MRIAILFIFLCFAMVSCKKEITPECYDPAMEQHFKSLVCTQDCPGVIGCDGKNYCNECIANQHGIKIDK